RTARPPAPGTAAGGLRLQLEPQRRRPADRAGRRRATGRGLRTRSPAAARARPGATLLHRARARLAGVVRHRCGARPRLPAPVVREGGGTEGAWAWPVVRLGKTAFRRSRRRTGAGRMRRRPRRRTRLVAARIHPRTGLRRRPRLALSRRRAVILSR